VFDLFLIDNRHVQVNNDSALEFYKKSGFEVVERKEQYYKRIEPSDAFVLRKSFTNKKAANEC
jgi:ribosomal protein S18 acetylase RimI-like enzyme